MRFLDYIRKHKFILLEWSAFILLGCAVFLVVLSRILRNDEPTKPLQHQVEKIYIDSQIDIFHERTGHWPKDLQNSSWGAEVNTFFPKGIPQACPNGTPWRINSATKHIDLKGHEAH